MKEEDKKEMREARTADMAVCILPPSASSRARSQPTDTHGKEHRHRGAGDEHHLTFNRHHEEHQIHHGAFLITQLRMVPAQVCVFKNQ